MTHTLVKTGPSPLSGRGHGVTYRWIVDRVNRILSRYSERLTIRQIYYQLVAHHGLANNPASYRKTVGKLVTARERGDVDYTRIEDRSREVLGRTSFDDGVEDRVDSIAKYLENPRYVRSVWADQPEYVEVWVEKDALSGILQDIAGEYQVVTCPSRGHGSFSYVKEAIDDRFSNYDGAVTILHFSDHDPSGLDMTRDLERRLNEYSDGGEITVERIALTIDQVRQHSLPPNPVKLSDSRSTDYIANYGEDCWELDALEPDVLRVLVRGAIERHLDTETRARTLSQEQEEAAELKARLERAARAIRNE